MFTFTFSNLWKRVRMIDDSLPANSVKPRLGVIGSGAGSNLGALAAAMERGELHAEIVLVISDVADAGILTKARARGIASHFVDPGPFKTRLSDEAQEKMAALLQEARVDFVICAGFMRRLKEPVLLAFPRRILNVHPSLLPRFPGRDAVGQALAAGVLETGCTVHLVNEEIDSGDILAQAKVPVLPGDTHGSLTQRVNAAEHILYPQAVAEYFWEMQNAECRMQNAEAGEPGGPKRRPNPVVATATLLRPTGERTWEAQLPNGMITIGHIPKWKLESMRALAAGQKVRLELTTYDFGTARIAGLAAD